MSWRKQAKKRAAIEAVKHVKNGFILGLGSGSTAAFAIQAVGERIQEERLQIMGVPTSHQAFALAIRNNIPMTTLDEHPQIDLAIDGADQIDAELNLIKGMGGALTREKIVASAANQFIVVADQTKMTHKLGANHPIPLEVLPFAISVVKLELKKMGGKAVLRDSRTKMGPVITDNGNFILDVDFGPLTEPQSLDLKLRSIPGIIETGLFIDMADIIYVGGKTTLKKCARNHTNACARETYK